MTARARNSPSTSSRELVEWSRQTAGDLTLLRAGTQAQTRSRLLRRRSSHQLGLRLRRRAAGAFPTRRSAATPPWKMPSSPAAQLPEDVDARMPRPANDAEPVMAFAFDLGHGRLQAVRAAGHRRLRRNLRDQVFRQESAPLLGPQRREDRRAVANRVARLREASGAMRGLRQGTDGRHDESWRREICEDHRAGLSRMRCRQRPGRRCQQAAAASSPRKTPATAISPRWTCSSPWTRSGSFSARRWRRPRWSTC